MYFPFSCTSCDRDDEKISSFIPKSLALSLLVFPLFHQVNFHFVTRWYWKFRCIRYDDILFCGPLNWTVEKIHFHTFHKQMQSEVKIPCCDFLTFTTHRSFLEQVVICKEMAFLQIPRFPRATSMDILSEACWYLPWTSSCVNAEEY